MFIEIGICNYKLLIPLIYPIIRQIQNFTTQKEISYLYQIFLNFLSYFSTGLIYIIVVYRSRKKKNENDINDNKKNQILPSVQIKNQIYLDRKNINNKLELKKKLSIFFLVLLNLVALLIENVSINLANINPVFTNSFDILITIFVYVVFSKIILDTKIYFHQYISLIIITSCLFIFLAKDIIVNFNNFYIGNFIISFACSILVFGLYALFDVLTKRHFIINLNSPYHFMFFTGFFSLIMLTPLELIYYFKFDGTGDILKDSIIKEIIKYFSNDSKYTLWFIFDIFLGLIRLGSMTLTIYYFTPCHFVISQVLSQIIASIIKWTEKANLKIIILSSVLYIIVFIFTLIYNEIIIIKLCSMEKNTSKYISKRESSEFRTLSEAVINEKSEIAGNDTQQN